MANAQIDKCFVVMPFGVKPKHGESHGTYDFDKVYRVIIQRAIRQAGMEPIRADETKGSRSIHADMFKDLRDRSIVLADLSLYNPNVFYELGIRHVMSPCGTVLMCCAGSPLPFDVNLSRVIFYEYDGKSLDWDEAERVIRELTEAINEAKLGKPDSPVHAFLEQVLSVRGSNTDRGKTFVDQSKEESLDFYQEMVARHWLDRELKVPDLMKEHGTSVFGIRAIGYLCLQQKVAHPQASQVARDLYNFEQYDLANKVFEIIKSNYTLSFDDLLTYGSSVSEEQLTLANAERGIDYMNEALKMVLPDFEQDQRNLKTIGKIAKCYFELSGMHIWRWQLSKTDSTLDTAIETLKKANEFAEKLMARDSAVPLSEITLNRLKLMLLLRIKDNNPERRDVEGLREKILQLKTPPRHPARDTSYLRWYQIITLADAGHGEEAYKRAINASSEDSRIMDDPECSDIGRRQYTRLRRFLEQYSSYWCDPQSIGRVSQVLQLVDGS